MITSSAIVLDVSKPEYTYKLKPSERWQKAAQGRLIDALTHIGKQAQKYLVSRKEEKSKRVFAAHDAIFLSAQRGGGKTAFLHNIEDIWQDAVKEDTNAPSIFFCDPIDPTLLVNNDNFANVVVAQLYSVVESHLVSNHRSDKREKFVRKLQKLADALAQTEEQRQILPGIDRIVGYRCGIELEEAFHDYVAICRDILNVDAIAIRIDDVDMALRKAFDVLDVVRRLLSCPLIIPIVSGDESLFRPIVENHFVSGGVDGERRLLKQEQAEDLTAAYLAKIFPNQYRVSLVGLESLLQHMFIRDIVDESKDRKISLVKYFKRIDNVFCPLVNGSEGSFDRPEPSNPRELVQMVRAFPPRSICGTCPKDLWYQYRIWAEGYQHGAAYVVAETEQQLHKVDRSSAQVIRLDELLAFSVIKQVESEVWWKSYNYYESDLSSFATEESPAWRIEQKEKCSWLKGKQIFNALPPIEFFFHNLQIPKKEVKDSLLKVKTTGSKPSSAISLIGAIYLHNTYYGASGKTGALLFFGRAFELLAGSLLLATSRKTQERQNEAATIAFWQNYVRTLLSTPPFHSISSLVPTKILTPAEGYDDLSHEISSEISFDYMPMESELMSFAKELKEWEDNYGELVVRCQQDGLVHLLATVMNKVFTQLHVMKNGVFDNDQLCHAVVRFEVVFINAMATFLKPDEIVLEDVARTPQIKSLENLSGLFQSTSALRTNVFSYVGVRNKKKSFDGNRIKLNPSLQQKLLQAIWKHPLFCLNDAVVRANLLRRYNDDRAIVQPISSDTGDSTLDSLEDFLVEDVKKLTAEECREKLIAASKEMQKRKISSDRLKSQHFSRYNALFERYSSKKRG